MIRIGRIVKIKPEFKEKYIAYHQSVWESVLKSIKSAGISNYSIFNYGDLLFSYYEMDSNDNRELEKILADEDSAKWEEIMIPMQENIDGIEGVTWTDMKQIFYME